MASNSEPEDALLALRKQLAAAPPPAVAQLGADELRHLSEAIAAARHQQAAELAKAGEKALGHIPKLLRAPVRKVLGR